MLILEKWLLLWVHLVEENLLSLVLLKDSMILRVALSYWVNSTHFFNIVHNVTALK